MHLSSRLGALALMFSHTNVSELIGRRKSQPHVGVLCEVLQSSRLFKAHRDVIGPESFTHQTWTEPRGQIGQPAAAECGEATASGQQRQADDCALSR